MSSIVIDTNLLILYVVATASRDYVARHKRLNAFCAEDYDVLLAMIELCRDDTTLVTTDLGLYMAAAKSGARVVNFNHHQNFFASPR